MSFTAQIGQLTGDASTNDATTIAQALENAQIDTIQKVSQIQPEMLHLMSSEVNSNSNTASNNNLVNNIVLNVTRVDSTTGYLVSKTGAVALVDATSSSSDVYNAQSVTVSMIIRFLDRDTDCPIFTSNNLVIGGAGTNGYRIRRNAKNNIYFEYGKVGDGSSYSHHESTYKRIISDYTIEPNVWYNIIVKSNASTTDIFINGVKTNLITTGSFALTSFYYHDSNSRSHIGYHMDAINGAGSPTEYTGNFNLKNFGIYNTLLDDSNIYAIYNNANYIDLLNNYKDYTSSGDLVLYYDFTKNTLADLKGNQSDLSLTNTTVESNKFDASLVDKKFITQVQDLNSVYYADSKSPVYSIENGKVQIYPEPSATELAYITKVVPGTIDDSSETIANMPRLFHTQIIKIASYYVLLKKIGDLKTTMVSEYNDAINKAKDLIDNDATLTGSAKDAEYWLGEEDPEMLSGTLNTAGQEIQRASAVANKFSSDLQMMQNQLAIIKQLVDEGWASIFNPNTDKNISRIGAK